ncbi:hypothetical protein ED733_007959 [Metarhizium rileyi]|uniref:DUF4604 domain-containing protein n=1 Tax=Metarhizium rileyi (strain RCEF 4871) TaxID=1649241 RepID=A0A5C6GH96_METRR|nr:hypothetical protein ED733_007959 [Metarhizium rileyi]
MPEKITSKNLSYSSSLPPFLARLHAQSAGSTGPDPLLAAHKRPTKKRSGSEEAEDAPLVVDEHGNTVDLRLDEDGAIDKTEDKSDGDEVRGSRPDEKRDSKVKASIGARKRKAGRVIGESANDATDKAEKDQLSGKSGIAEASVDKKAKKKAKKIKLSFDEDEG